MGGIVQGRIVRPDGTFRPRSWSASALADWRALVDGGPGGEGLGQEPVAPGRQEVAGGQGQPVAGAIGRPSSRVRRDAGPRRRSGPGHGPRDRNDAPVSPEIAGDHSASSAPDTGWIANGCRRAYLEQGSVRERAGGEIGAQPAAVGQGDVGARGGLRASDRRPGCRAATRSCGRAGSWPSPSRPAVGRGATRAAARAGAIAAGDRGVGDDRAPL